MQSLRSISCAFLLSVHQSFRSFKMKEIIIDVAFCESSELLKQNPLPSDCMSKTLTDTLASLSFSRPTQCCSKINKILLLRQQPAAPLFFTLSLPARSIRFLAFHGFVCSVIVLCTSFFIAVSLLRAKPMCCFWSVSLTHPKMCSAAVGCYIVVVRTNYVWQLKCLTRSQALIGKVMRKMKRAWLREDLAWVACCGELFQHESHIQSPEIPAECSPTTKRAWAFGEAK